jgi:signal transduction histidine kinase
MSQRTAQISDQRIQPPVAPLRVLLVDDNPIDREVVSRLLTRYEPGAVQTQEADSAQSALDTLRSNDADAVCVDYRLNGTDGLDLVRTLRNEFAGLAIVMLTGQGSEQIAADSIKAGADEYLIKRELTGSGLLNALRRAISASHSRTASRHEAEQLRRSHVEMDHFVRALSHDMTANFMLLESSFAQARRAEDQAPARGLIEAWRHVDACLQESKRFLHDLVTLGQTGAVDMEPAAVVVQSVVSEVLFEQEQLIFDRRVQVEVEGTQAVAWVNRHRLKQVLTNLVRNALRHGCDREQPRLRIVCSEVEAGARVALRVEDNGRGIAPEKRDEIFLPGKRLAQAHPEGSGMGLAIVRKIVEHFGGSVWATERAGGAGTAFVVVLPAAANRMPLPEAAMPLTTCATPTALV